jgi:tRNA modification GTPase
MTFDIDDTIVAVASPPGGARRGIIRISGNETLERLKRAFDFSEPFEPAQLTRSCSLPCELKLRDQARLPGKLLVWPDCHSYTRQPSAEFHTLGSPPLLQLATAAICRCGARLADRGEFTLRAFLSGRIDLTQAEAVLAVIDSKEQSQLESALRQLSGGLAAPLANIRTTLISVLAELEAGLDFVEEDIEFISQAELEASLTHARNQLAAINEQIRQRHLNREACMIALVGPPNAGKSSLFNALLEDYKAIVTNVEGTTRDFVSANVRWNQCDLTLIDTAGVAELMFSNAATDRAIESQAQFHTERVIDQSDVVLLCLDVASFRQQAGGLFELLNSRDPQSVIVVLTKTDLEPAGSTLAIAECAGLLTSRGYSGQVIATSSQDLSGLEQLRQTLVAHSRKREQMESSFVATTATRAATSLESAERSLVSALRAAEEDLGLEIVAAEIRQSLDELGTVVGTVYTDDILDQVFGRFCIGK